MGGSIAALEHEPSSIMQHILGQHVSGAPFRTESPHGLVSDGEHCEHHNHGHRCGPPLEETPTEGPTRFNEAISLRSSARSAKSATAAAIAGEPRYPVMRTAACSIRPRSSTPRRRSATSIQYAPAR